MKRPLTAILLLLAACSSPPPAPRTDPAIAQYASSARAAYERGNLTLAGAMYEKGLQIARARDDGSRIDELAYNLAACRLALAQTNGVAALLAEVRAERKRLGRDTDDLDLLAANLARRTGDAAAARDTAMRIAAKSPQSALREEAMLFVGLLALDAGDADALDHALAQVTSARSPLALYLRAAAAALQGQPAAAAAGFDVAAEQYRALGRVAEMTDALEKAAVNFGAAGQPAEMAARYYRAARSAQARGDIVRALQLIDRGLGALVNIPDATAKADLLVLFEEIKSGLPATP